jgi:hypothetical protein
MPDRTSLLRGGGRTVAMAALVLGIFAGWTSSASPTSAAVQSGGWTWHSSSIAGGSGARSLQCPSISACFFVAHNRIWWTTSPAATHPAWHSTVLKDTSPYATDHGLPTEFTALSCPSLSFCVATDSAGSQVHSHSPTGDPSTWQWQMVESPSPMSLSCVSTNMCALLDNAGEILTGSNPDSPSGGNWWVRYFSDVKNAPAYSISCAATSHCVAVEGSTEVGYTNGAGHFDPSWHFLNVPGSRWNGANCPVADRCVIVGRSSNGGARLAISNSSSNTASTWHALNIGNAGPLRAIDCSSKYFCMTVTATTAWFSGTLKPTPASWHLTSPPVGKAHLQYVSCPSSRHCFLLTGNHVLIAGSR